MSARTGRRNAARAVTGAARAVTGMAALGGLVVAVRRAALVVTVRGESMQPGLNDGDRVLLLRTGGRGLHRGDVVVMTPPVLPFEGPGGGSGEAAGEEPPRPGRDRAPDLVIKRVTALPGDRLPDGVPHAVIGLATADGTVPRGTVPDGTVVVLGDRPDRSVDSRSYGPVPLRQVVGRVVRRLPRRD